MSQGARGGNFFVLERDAWQRLWNIEPSSRFAAVIAYLVLLAGTGRDQRATRWSLKACYTHAGLGRPRASAAVEHLIQHRLLEVVKTDRSDEGLNASSDRPAYRFVPIEGASDPIFLPKQFVTGFSGESSILRRVRELHDELALHLIIELYGACSIDITYAVPPSLMRVVPAKHATLAKLFDHGPFTAWAVRIGDVLEYEPSWPASPPISQPQQRAAHIGDGRLPPLTLRPMSTILAAGVRSSAADFQTISLRPFLSLLRIGAIRIEPWVFERDSIDAEPLLPLDPGAVYGRRSGDMVASLSEQAMRASAKLAGNERAFLLERYPNSLVLPLPSHLEAPACFGLVRPEVEADTIGVRMAFNERQRVLDHWLTIFEQISKGELSLRVQRSHN